jgi:hypothetical protein
VNEDGLDVARALQQSDARTIAARYWFGYGSWSAPYWFVGMEPGGDDDRLSYETCIELAGSRWDGLIDCKAHHDAWNARASGPICHWHDGGIPPIQRTWGPLIRTLLAYQRSPDHDEDVARYQRDGWGRKPGCTAVLELSALHARNLGVDIERTAHRSERIRDLEHRLACHRPRFALFYGTSYRTEYEKVVGAFGPDATTWFGTTLCVLTVHPAYRFAPGRDYWYALGAWLREAVDAGPSQALRARPRPQEARRVGPRADVRAPVGRVAATEYVIEREGSPVGRIVYDGWNMQVERRLADGTYAALGAYERSRKDQFTRKCREIDDVFDDWCATPVSDPSFVRVAWRAAKFVPQFRAPEECLPSGCAVVLERDAPIAYIYKTRSGGAVWLPATSDAR